MKIKEQIIHESIKRIKSRLVKINKVMDATPLSDIIRLRQKVYPKINKMNLTDPETIKMVSEAADKEKALFKLARQQEKTNELITEKVELESQLGDLNNELYVINMRKSRY